jgi:hypothetical protein
MSTSGGSPRRTRTTQRSATPPAVRAKLAEIEAKIRTRKTEAFFLVDAQGNQIAKVSGTNQKVRIPREVWSKAEGTYAVHNHPYITAFSPEDVSFAMTTNVAEARVVDSKWTYSVRPGPGGWSSALYNSMAHEFSIGGTYWRMRNQLRSDVLAGRMSVDEANERGYHETWLALAPKYGFIYERSPA